MNGSAASPFFFCRASKARSLKNLCFLFFLLIARSVIAETLLPTDVTILTREDLTGRNYHSVADALESVPSVNIEREGARGTRARAKIRGASQSNKVLVLLDGHALNPDYEGDVDLSQLPVNIVERIEITRGGSSLSYSGEAVAGTIHIVTSRPEQKGFNSRLGTGVGRDGVRHHHGRFFGTSFVGHLTYLTSQEVSGGFMEHEEAESNNHFINLTRSFKGDGFIGGEYFFQESEVQLSSGTPVPFEQWNTQLEKLPVNREAFRQQEFQQAKILFGSPEIKGGHLYANFTESWREHEEKASLSGLTLRSVDYRTSKFDLRWRRKGWETGVEKRLSQRTFAGSIPSKVHRTSFYLIRNWTSNRWTLRPALRYDRPSDARAELNPRAVILWQLKDNLFFSSTLQRSVRTPTFEELFHPNGSHRASRLNGEAAWSYDLGAGHRSGRHQFKLTGFVIQIDKLIQFDASANTYVNRGKEKIYGGEAQLTFYFGQDTKFRHFSSEVHWMFQKSRRSLEDGRGFLTSPLSPSHLGFFRLNHHLPLHFTLSNELRYQSGQFELDDKRGVRIPAYVLWNVRTRVKILGADLYFDIENVTRRRYADTLFPNVLINGTPRTVLSPQPERTYWTGVSIRFRG